MMNYHIIAEDLAQVLITPFPDKASAEAHVKFCTERGDDATMEIINDDELKHYDSDSFGLILTPEEDIRWGNLDV